MYAFRREIVVALGLATLASAMNAYCTRESRISTNQLALVGKYSNSF